MRTEITAYCDLAEQYSARLIWEEPFMGQVASLPPLTHALLDELHQVSVQVARTRPRLGWSLLVVASAAAQQYQPADPFLQAKAAWYEAYSANEWVDMGRAAAALDRAEPLFADLGESGWLAACQWQRRAHPWTQPSFSEAHQILTTALEKLEAEPKLAHWVPQCRLSLAYAQLLTYKDFMGSLEQIELSETEFRQQGDRLHQARCKFTRAANLRRQTRFEEALREGVAALAIFQTEQALADIARTQNLLTFIYWLHQGDFAAALQSLQNALDLFEQLEMPLWIQQARLALAQLQTATGNLVEAKHILEQLIPQFREQNLIGSWGDSLYDQAVNASWRNDYDHSLALFSEAQSLAEEHQLDSLLALALIGKASIYESLNRYQDALAATEPGYQYFVRLNNNGRMASCEIEQAAIWLHVGRPDKAHEWLDKAEEHQQLAQQAELLPFLHFTRAETFYRQGRLDEAITILQTARHLSHQQEKTTYVALMNRLLSRVLLESGRLEEAADCLRQAEAHWIQRGQELEQAACQLIWGEYYHKMGNTAAATQVWQRVLQLNQDVLPELLWQAQAGLAGLALEQGLVDEALVAYAAATWANFLKQAKEQGLQQYNWLHIASHAFHDRVTGWLSGFALHDRDVWLTELKQCAPLPHLMTLSVCSGSRNHVQHGDEQISLSTTCLVAGAQTVISNLWPLPDDTTPEWMGLFYSHLSNGKNIAQALALAQRTAWEQQIPLFQWSGFSCMGQP